MPDDRKTPDDRDLEAAREAAPNPARTAPERPPAVPPGGPQDADGGERDDLDQASDRFVGGKTDYPVPD